MQQCGGHVITPRVFDKVCANVCGLNISVRGCVCIYVCVCVRPCDIAARFEGGLCKCVYVHYV